MSYDLYFYKKKGANLTEIDIPAYLTNNLVAVNEDNGHQWFFVNEDTDVYFSFDLNDPETEEDSVLNESFEDFENTNISFNLNFMRPAFFGLEAFKFVETFIADLDLYILNPQGNSEIPSKYSKEQLFDEWNYINLRSSAEYFKEFEASYMSQAKSTNAWIYNINRSKIQTELGENYFVPRLYFFKYNDNDDAFTVAIWPNHIPIVIPPADYFLLVREYKKLFRTIKENVLISRDQLFSTMGSHFDDFNIDGCKIIHPGNALNLKSKFNTIKPELILDEIGERLNIEKLYNAKPGE